MATGQGAGCAAALACKSNEAVLDISLEELKEALVNIGAIVPEK